MRPRGVVAEGDLQDNHVGGLERVVAVRLRAETGRLGSVQEAGREEGPLSPGHLLTSFPSPVTGSPSPLTSPSTPDRVPLPRGRLPLPPGQLPLCRLRGEIALLAFPTSPRLAGRSQMFSSSTCSPRSVGRGSCPWKGETRALSCESWLSGGPQ